MSITILNKTQCGGDLLPSIEKVEDKKGRDLSSILTIIAERSLTALINSEFAVFDAPVGDNSCKIRAAKIALIALRVIQEPSFKEEITALLKQLPATREKIKELSSETALKCNLKEWRKQKEIEFELSSDLAFLIRSHFLFLVRKEGVHDQTGDPSALQRIAPIAASAAKNWIHLIKVQLAESSVFCVRQEASQIDTERREIVLKMVAAPFTKIYEKKPVLTNCHSMEVLFTHALKCRQLVIFKSDEESFLFHPNHTQTTFIRKEVEHSDLTMPAIVIKGKIEDRPAFLSGDFFQLLLAKTCQDPQYLEGKRAEEIPFELFHDDPQIAEEKARFESLQRAAVPFHIQHIFCDRVSNLMRVKQTIWLSCNWMGDELTEPRMINI